VIEEYPVIALISRDGQKPYLDLRRADGTRYAEAVSQGDLLPPKQYVYLNIYKVGTVGAHTTAKQARQIADMNITLYEHIAIPLELPEGVTIP